MSKISKKYACIYFFFHAITSVVYGFGVYTLTQRGFDYTSAGACLSFSGLIAFVLQFVLANNKSKKIGTFEISVILSSLIFVFMLINTFISKADTFLAIIFVIGTCFYIALEAFINVIPGEFALVGTEVNYSTPRAFGSLSYALFCFLFGKLSVKYSYLIILIFANIFAFMLTFFLVFIRKDYVKLDFNKANEEEKNEEVGYDVFFRENKKFVVLVFFLTLIYFGYFSFDNFMLAVVEEVEGNSDNLGSILGFKAILETLSIFFLFPFLSKKIKLNNILKISALSFVLKIFLQTIASNVLTLYIAQVMQIFSYALMYPGMVLYINNNLKKNALTKGQVLYMSTIIIASFFVGLVVGYITDNFGIKMAEYIALVVSLIGFIGYYITMGVNENGK